MNRLEFVELKKADSISENDVLAGDDGERVWCETLTQADAATAADTATTSRRSTGTCNLANLYLKNKEEYNSSHLYLNLSPPPFFPNALYVGQLYQEQEQEQKWRLPYSSAMELHTTAGVQTGRN